MARQDTSWKIALLGGDEQQAEGLLQAASMRGYTINYFESMLELGYVGRFREFDAAIVHQDFQPLSGLELAEYLEKLFQSLPMILLTPDSERLQRGAILPASIVACFKPEHSPHAVLERAEAAAALRSAPFLAAVKHL